MRIFEQSASRRVPAIRVINLVDILFILLIFFIATTTFRSEQVAAVKVALPVAKTAEELGKTKVARLLVTVAPDETVYLDNRPIDVASLTEPLSCAVHASRILNPYVSEDVVVLGAGVMGLMNVVALKRRGARVIVSEIDAGRLAKAKAMGADELIDASKEDPIARVKDLTEGRGTEAVICAFGGGSANEQALAMLSEKGRMVLFAGAYPEAPLTLAPNKMHDHERQVIGVVSGDKQDFYIASRLIRYHQVDLSPLIQATYPLTQLGEALDASLKPGSYRIIVEP